jgi:hypothetical protein
MTPVTESVGGCEDTGKKLFLADVQLLIMNREVCLSLGSLGQVHGGGTEVD